MPHKGLITKVSLGMISYIMPTLGAVSKFLTSGTYITQLSAYVCVAAGLSPHVNLLAQKVHYCVSAGLYPLF